MQINKPVVGQVYNIKPESVRDWRSDTLTITYVGADYFTYEEQDKVDSSWVFELLEFYTLQEDK